MTCAAGRYGRIQVSADGGTTYFNLGAVVDMSLSGNIDELECTSHDSATREYVPNFFDATMDVSCRYSAADPGQLIVLNSIFPTPSLIKIQFDLPDDLTAPSTGDRRFSADAFATSPTWEAPLDDTAAFNTTFRLSNIIASVIP